METRKCKDVVREHYKGRMETIRKMWELNKTDPEACTEDGDNWSEYGLSFDYVAPGTFRDQRRGYWRYQISWGGPSDEFRFFCDENCEIIRLEYWFMNWFDGAKIVVTGKDLDLWREIWCDWKDCEVPQAARAKAMEN